MAKAKDTGEKTKKKKQSIVQRVMFGNDNKPDLTPEKMNVSKWAQFKNLFFGRFGTIVALNLLTCLFALPAVAVLVLFYMNKTIGNGFIPYSSNFGIGYPVITDAARLGEVMTFTYNLYEFALLVPCLAVFALGVAGNLYVMRKLIWEEPRHRQVLAARDIHGYSVRADAVAVRIFARVFRRLQAVRIG